MISHNFSTWAVAIVIGSLVNMGLFLFLPAIGRTPPPQEPQIIELEFMAWQQPIQQKAKVPKKTKPPPKEQPRPKPKSKPKKIKQPPKIAPKPKPVPRPVLSEVVVPEKNKPKPIEKPVTKPALTTPKTLPVKEVAETKEVALPTPMPIFKLTSLPRMIHRQIPTYPPSMKQQGKEATVKLEVLLDIKGEVRRVTIKKSAGEMFDKAAIEAIKSSTFMPANIDGKPVAVLMKIPVKFRLR